MVKESFGGRFVVIGCGSVGRCALPILFEQFDITPQQVTVLDFADNRERIQDLIERGVTYHIQRISEDNYSTVLSRYLKSGDVLIDLGWNIDTVSLIQWCRENGILFVNTSVEVWDPYAQEQRHDPREHTLYVRQMTLKKMVERWGDNKGPTAIVDHGANPGLVSHFTKEALKHICEKIHSSNPRDARGVAIEKALGDRDFPAMAHLSGVKVIHISERDTQIATQPKRVNEFVNTWSIEGLYEEGVAPAEMGWGTHERVLPPNAFTFENGPQNQICLASLGVNTSVRSWVPSGPIVGMVIRHGEAFGISDRLTVWDGDTAVYRPTVHYVYCPCDAAIASLHELRMRQYDLQSDQRIMSNEIESGWDELGVLVMGHDLNAWWTGTVLDIDEARRLVPNQNATTVQVAISVVAAVKYMLKHPNQGFCLPDDIDEREILEVASPYLGRIVSQQTDWNPLRSLDVSYTAYGRQIPSEADMWQYGTFSLGAGIFG